MRILLACDKFKGTLTSAQVAEALAAPLEAAGHTTASVPVADGGDGTVAAALAAGFSPRTSTVTGPLGDPVRAQWAVQGETAIIELAEASGIALLSPTRSTAFAADTRGTGELVSAALDAGCTRIVLGVGGSSSTDGGAGMLTALGARLLDSAGDPVAPGAAGLAALASADLSGLDARLDAAEVVLASDVDNPLLGPRGAAAVYGPQKGAEPEDVTRLDAALAHLLSVLGQAPGADARAIAEAAETPGAGAAGGTGFGALAGLGARLRPGAEYIMELVGFDAELVRAAAVVTGEGRFDRQTLSGKGPGEVIARAQERGLPVWVVCGASELEAADLRGTGVSGVVEMREFAPVETCLAEPERVLAEAASALAARLA
ncbi:glycerate kinase [Brevibacterium album]|uniref:glycerate kinase n=1 Tax=Brevibacterium album TaxID=417948 RepID=UPI000418EC6A|nr:glycerate kinase [Brevibacterium album]